MKILFTPFLILTAAITYSQTGSNLSDKLNNKLNNLSGDKSKGSKFEMHMNQNKMVSQLKEGTTWVFGSYDYHETKFNFYALSVIKKDRKDSEGNEIYHLVFTNTKDTITLVPDFEPFALSFQNTKTGVPFMIANGESIFQVEYKRTDMRDQPMAPAFDLTNKNGVPVFAKVSNSIESKKLEEVPMKLTGKANEITLKKIHEAYKTGLNYGTEANSKSRYFGETGGFMGGYASQYELYGSREQQNLVAKYIKEQLERNKTKDMIAQAELIGDGEYLVCGGGTSQYGSHHANFINGKVRVKLIKKNGKLTQIQIQKPFTDGVFYDKEKFFKTVNVKPGQKWVVHPDDDNLKLVLYDGMILAVYNSSIAMMYTNEVNIAHNLMENKHYGSGRINEYRYCQEELETNYDENKDWVNIENAIKLYLK